MFHGTHNFSTYHCVEHGCNRSFHLKNTYRKHILRFHVSVAASSPSSVSSVDIPLDNTVLSQINEPTVLALPSTSNLNNFALPSTSNLNDYTLPIFISSLYANPLIPKNAVQDIVEGMSKYLSNTLSSNIENIFKETSISLVQDENVKSLLKDRVLSAVTSPIKQFDTEYKRLQYFAKEGNYIPPKEIVIGQRMCTVSKRGVVTSVPTECKEQCIPLRFVLQKFFSLNNVLAETLDYCNNLPHNGYIKNFIQGSFWTNVKKRYKDKLVFPLYLFFDDYESGNVLGSHSGIHKLGAVYVSIGCIPPDRASALANIFLALLFHSSDRTAFGNSVVFHPLIEELNFLAESGVDIDVPSFQGKLYFNLALLIGDNLGIHSITGFNETFSSNHPCRICNVSKEIMKKQLFEEKQMLRNVENYSEQLQINCSAITGIKEKCVWLSVNDFNLFEQVGVDIMHDILEGVAKYIMAFIIKKYTRDLRYFSLEVLNARIVITALIVEANLVR